MVRFGYSEFADIRGGLTDKIFVYAGNHYFVGAGTFKLYAVGLGEVYGVREADIENDLVALFCNLPADSVYTDITARFYTTWLWA